jgi:hypothetical protein
MPNIYEAIGIGLQVGDPVYRATRRPHIETITTALSSYQHVKSAWLGNDKAQVDIKGDISLAEDWMVDGLGRDIIAFDESAGEIFGGFVNQIDLNIGDLSISRGPLLDIANRVSVRYAPVDTTVNPPVVGDSTFTVIAEDAASQEKYGIIERILSAGQVTDSQAEQIRDTYLSEHAEPDTSQDINVGGREGAAIRLSILGYGHWLQTFIYNQIVSSGTTTATDKIKAALAAEPNGIFSSDLSRIDDNLILVSAYENDYPTGITIIKETVALGDVNDDRYLFMVGAGRKISYQLQDTHAAYQRGLARTDIILANDDPVKPWQVEAGKWIFVNDFMASKLKPTNPRLDTRMIFIEELTYTAPYGLSLAGSRTNRLTQKLAKIGMGGISS